MAKKKIKEQIKDKLTSISISTPGLRDKAKPRFASNFKWDNFIENLFSPESRVKIHKFFLFSLVVITTFLIGKHLALWMSTSTDRLDDKGKKKIGGAMVATGQRKSTQELNDIQNANLFNTKSGEEQPAITPIETLSTPAVGRGRVRRHPH